MPSAQINIDLPERYRVLRHVATGGMAAVYAAEDLTLGREVAIKVLSPALTVDDSARERFTREARAAARVSDHPNVVTIYDIGETDADPAVTFIVMELLTGGTVHERLRAGEPIPHALALRWLEQTAAALDAAHQAGMVHRDVKPANLLLDTAGNIKVADFGIALLTTDAPLTQTGQVVGTAAYFSPEQALGKPATPASDRYSLAVLAFELLTGRRPFPPGPPAAQALARVDGDPPRATEFAPGLPYDVDAVLARGMAREPDERPATGAELVAALEDALGPTASTGAAVPAPLPETEVVRQRTPRPAPAAVVASGGRDRNRAGVLAAIAALLLIAGATIAAAVGGGDDPKQAASSHPATTARKHRAQRTTSTATTQPTVNAASTGPATTATTPPTTASGAPADAAGIQADAHQRIANGDYQGAIGELQGLVNRCPVEVTDPCAYAWFDLGRSLRLAGDPSRAIPVLEHRLQNPDQQSTVQAELDAARAAAGSGGSSSGGEKVPPGQAKKGKREKG